MFERGVGEVGCFGKLPLSPEFIRVNAKGETLQAFDQWLQEGLLSCRGKLGLQWRNDFLQSEPWNFLFQVPQKKEWLVGVMTPSQDKAGRGFPMTLFFRVENFDGEKKDLPMLPLLFQEFLEKAKTLIREEWKNLSLAEFRMKVEKLNQANPLKLEQVSELYHEFLNSYSLRSFLRLCGVSTQCFTEEELKGIIHKMVHESGHSIPSHNGQFMSFPIIHEPAYPFEIPFWMEYVFCMYGERMTTPLLFWNKCPTKGRAVLFAQDAPVAPKSFWALLHSNEILESAWKMDSIDESDITLENEVFKLSPQQNNHKNNSLKSLVLGQPM